MDIANIVLVYSLLAGIMSILLTVFTVFFEKTKKRQRVLLIWSVLFLASSFGTTEYAFWLEGYNLFTFVLGFNFPLFMFFALWFAFLIWLFETRGERTTWVTLLILLSIIILVAVTCMDCLKL
jgi:hypothetical protein